MEKGVIPRHGAEQHIEFEVLAKCVRLAPQRLAKMEVPILEQEMRFHDAMRSLNACQSVTPYFSATYMA